MFTLMLQYLPGGQYTRAACEAVRSTYIPQIGSTINGEVRSGVHRVVLVSHSVGSDGTLDETVQVYLAETDFDELI